MTTKNYGNYAQTSINAYKAQFDGSAATGGEATANSAAAKSVGKQIGTMTDRLQLDKSFVQQDIAKGNTVDLGRAEGAYAADIATLHNLERQYAAATGDSANLKRLQDNPDQTGLGTTNELLAQAGATNSKGAAATDKEFTYYGQGTVDGTTSIVTAELNAPSSTAQGTAGFVGPERLEGSSSGPNTPPIWWGNGSAFSGGEGM